MMFGKARRIIDDMRARGVRLRSDGCRVWAGGPLTPDDTWTITEHRAELLAWFEFAEARAHLRERLDEAREQATAQRAA